MVEFSVMASSSLAFGSFRPDQLMQQHHYGGGICRVPFKEFQPSLPSQFTEEKDTVSNFMTASPSHCWDYQKSKLSSDRNQIIEPVSAALIDITDSYPDSALFSYGIAEQCPRREKILHFLTSGANVSDGRDIDFSILSDLMGHHALAIAMRPLLALHLEDMQCCDTSNVVQAPSHMEWNSPSSLSLMNCIDNMSNHSMTAINPDGQVLFTGTEDEIKSLLSTMKKVYMSQNGSTGIHRHQMVVPYFTRSGRKARSNTQCSSKAQTTILAPAKRLDKAKTGAFPKKKQKKKQIIEREACKSSYSQICEGLLSVILIKNQNEMAIYSLKRHGNELPGLLMQFSAGIAGAGLAVLFSVAWKLTNGKMPLCTTKMLNTGFGVGLIWLSSSVNMLRDTILDITKTANKLKLKDAEMTDKVERSVKEVLFRAVAVMALMVFKFA